ncbi:MAG: UDP-glucose/GDP-mannose dehydrogenase family protein, partial [Phycisphaerae bacterium]|nr:UDP-glucose/GDP-mannose dehydrogenase family protein [Phycisphaerae bacterium]
IIGTTNPDVMEIMKQLYAPFMRKSSRILYMDPASAELTKYAANVMLATRISFMNELSGLCEKFGADIEKVRGGIGSDGRIGNSFLFAGVGYGGSCFPKDVSALIHIGQSNDYPMTIAQSVQRINYGQQDRFSDKIIQYFHGREKQTQLGVWGLAFKARTDDIRESPAIRCVRRFVEAGIKVVAYDPQAAGGDLQGTIRRVANGYDVLAGSDALVIFTDWQEFRTPDFEEIAAKLSKPVIFDGRNLYDPKFVRRFGIEYHSIGRPVS